MMIGLSLALSQPRGVAALAPNLWTTATDDLTNALWVKTRTTATADVEGVADKLVEDATAASTHFVARSDAGIDNVRHLVSFEAKASGRDKFALYLFDADALTNLVFANVDLTAGTIAFGAVGGAGVVGAVSLSAAGGDGFRTVSMSGTTNSAGAGGLIQATLRLRDATGTQSYTGDGASGVLLRNFALRRDA